MHALSQLEDKQRNRIGGALFAFGLVMLVAGLLIAHYAQFAETELRNGRTLPVVVDYFGWIPRGWLPTTIGQIVATGGSQLLILGSLLVWVANRPMTWARAGFAAFVVWIELVIVFGIVPSEWLNLSQGPLDWTRQRIAFTIPRWLVLGNTIDISWAAIKDAISGAYNTLMLGAAIVFTYKIQDWGKQKAKAVSEEKQSLYGRPVIRGER